MSKTTLHIWPTKICVWVFGVSLAASQCAIAQDSMQVELASVPLSTLADEAKRFGDAMRGALVFYKPEMNCARCHDSTVKGRRLGPNLAEKRQVAMEHLAESILHPSKQISKGYETVMVRTLDGEVLTGVFVEEQGGTIKLDRIEEPSQLTVMQSEEVDEWKMSKLSSMPEQLVNQMTERQQFIDLLSYLSEIAVGGEERAQQLRPDSSFFATAPLPEYESRVDHRSLIESLNDDSFKRGEEIFRLRCESCHGTKEKVGSMPTSLRFGEGRFKRGFDPYSMYSTLTHGYGMMNAQRWMVPRQKYDVIHYIREHFLGSNSNVLLEDVSGDYLESLPKGDTLGPKPKIHRPWSTMDYGPSLNNTIEISEDGSNIAQKGIIVRLDPGPGGVESGRYWLAYDHDTMRVAGVWSEDFIDYNGIHFNGVHGQHPRISGAKWFDNPVGPGWGSPDNQTFEDDRIQGRDGKMYGPLAKEWLHFKGLHRFGHRTAISYSIGETSILESPTLNYFDEKPVVIRQLRVAARDRDLVLQILRSDSPRSAASADGRTLFFGAPKNEEDVKTDSARKLMFNGQNYVQSSQKLDMTNRDFTIYAEVRSGEDGSVFAQTRERRKWISDGKTFFIRDGRLHYDIGWVGVVGSKIRVDGETWRRIGMTWRSETGQTTFFVDGKTESAGAIKPQKKLSNAVQRIGFTNDDFPEPSFLIGEIRNVRFYDRCLSREELERANQVESGLVTSWSDEHSADNGWEWLRREQVKNKRKDLKNIVVSTTLKNDEFTWEETEEGDLRMRIFKGDEPISFSISFHSSDEPVESNNWVAGLANLESSQRIDLERMMQAGTGNWPQVLKTEVQTGTPNRGFQVDVIKRPVKNPWNDRMRLTGIDFINGGNDSIVSCWDGSIYRVNGITSTDHGSPVHWRRIAAGLFQPLGVRVVENQIFVICRDQLVRLHDLNGDGEMDWYENYNSDHQVTEHFHEFAMGLQTDDEGNFYYAKSARHALKAVVPHHGTLLRVAKDGSKTDIIANGFRAANGVCLNPDGTFIVTDQEGHWNPKNRINWVRPGRFYGNMFGYHDVADSSDSAMDPPLCWITNSFDRSPGELLWVTSKNWGPLQGSLLNLSYGTGQIFIVPHEEVNGKFQGGMCAFPMPRFPTGIMRGRFNPIDGQLYCCGMFAWAGDQHQPGGLYRIRHTGHPCHLPVGLECIGKKVSLQFSDPLDRDFATDVLNYKIETWDLKRTARYGSEHYNERSLEVSNAKLSSDAKEIELEIPELAPTWGMKILYSLKTIDGVRFSGEIHNSIHELAE